MGYRVAVLLMLSLLTVGCATTRCPHAARGFPSPATLRAMETGGGVVGSVLALPWVVGAATACGIEQMVTPAPSMVAPDIPVAPDMPAMFATQP